VKSLAILLATVALLPLQSSALSPQPRAEVFEDNSVPLTSSNVLSPEAFPLRPVPRCCPTNSTGVRNPTPAVLKLVVSVRLGAGGSAGEEKNRLTPQPLATRVGQLVQRWQEAGVAPPAPAPAANQETRLSVLFPGAESPGREPEGLQSAG